MNNVLQFKTPELVEPHLSGKARCCACGHECIQVQPVGVDWSECTQCHLMKVRFVHSVPPPIGSDKWWCACGCDVFHVTRTSAWCITCGLEQRFP